MGAADGNIMAIIIILHMLKTAITLAKCHSGVIGIISFVSGFELSNTAHIKNIQLSKLRPITPATTVLALG